MSEYKKLIMSARYSPTTVGNMVMDKNGEYCSSEAFEIVQAENAALKEQVAQLESEVEDNKTQFDSKLAMQFRDLAYYKETITTLQSKSAALVDALETIQKLDKARDFLYLDEAQTLHAALVAFKGEK